MPCQGTPASSLLGTPRSGPSKGSIEQSRVKPWGRRFASEVNPEGRTEPPPKGLPGIAHTAALFPAFESRRRGRSIRRREEVPEITAKAATKNRPWR